MQVGYKISGVPEILKTFGNLPRSTRNKAMRPALRAGAVVIRDAAAKNVAAVADKGYATGLLQRSIRVYSFRLYRGMLRMGVMVRRGLVSAKGVRVGLYASVLEYGKKDQAPASWIRKAAREDANAAFSAVAREASLRMDDALKDAMK